MLRAAPKKRFGLQGVASTPPERILPDEGTTVLYARAKRVIESRDYHIVTTLHHAFCFFKHNAGNFHMAFGLLVKRRGN